MPDRTTTKAGPSTLVEGQRLDQPTFHALYEAMPPGTRAELIDGVVYMPSPVGLAHGDAQLPALVWLDYYAENTPGVRALPEVTTILGWRSEPQPDGLLRILPECGGRTWDEGAFIGGAPELVVEVSKATRYVRPGAEEGRLRTSRGAGIPRARDRSGRDLLVRPGTGRAGAALDRGRRVVPFDRVSGPLARSGRTPEGRSASSASRGSTWAAPPPSTPRSSPDWPRPATSPFEQADAQRFFARVPRPLPPTVGSGLPSSGWPACTTSSRLRIAAA